MIVGIIALSGLTKHLPLSASRLISSNEQIRKRAFDAAASSEKVASSADQISHAMKEISSSVEQVTVGSSQSASATQEISNMMSRIHQMVQQIAAGAIGRCASLHFLRKMLLRLKKWPFVARLAKQNAAIKSAFESEKRCQCGLQRQ